MRTPMLLAALALTTVAVALPVTAATDVQAAGPDLVSFGAPCLNGGITLIVYGHTVLQCWKPLGAADGVEADSRCASEVCDLANTVCTIATKPVTKKDCVLVQ